VTRQRRRIIQGFGRKTLAAALASFLGATLLQAGMPGAADAASPTTLSADNYRTGWYDNQPALAPSNINSSSFGRVLDVALNGQIYASPVVHGTTVIAATENNYVYGIDTASGAIKWTKYLGAPVPATTTSCGDLTPNLGVTSTPVVDPSTGHVYVMNKTWDGSTNASIKYEFHAIDIATGNERTGWPAAVGGTANNVSTATFNAQWQGQRPGLLLLNGNVYAGFGGHCGQGPYRGWVAGFSTSSPVQTTLWSNADTPSDPKPEGGIWMGGGGLVSDGDGQILLTTGNGPPPPIGAGNSNPNLLGDSVVRLQVQNNGHLQATDFFSPSNADFLGIQDLDLGSGGVVALPEQYFGTTSHPKLAVQTGKEGITYLLDRTNLGGRSQGPNQTDNVIQKVGPYNGQWGHPAVYGGEGGWVYYTENSNKIRAFSYGVDSAGKPQLTDAGSTIESWGYTSGSPIITSNGTNPGSAVLWSMYTSGPTGADGKLRAYKTIPTPNGHLELLYEHSIGTMSKFATPTVDNGRVFIGTRDGHLMAYGSLNSNPILSANSTNFQTVSVGSSKTETVHFIANGTVTVSGFTTSNSAFTTGTPSVTLPATLNAGDLISVPVTYTPTSAGTVSANLGVTNNVQTLQVGLNGQGQAATALPVASPSTVAFGTVQTSTTATRNVTITNQGGTAFTINSVTNPSSPFSVSNAIPTGTTFSPGQSLSTTVNVAPTANGSLSSSLVFDTTAGTLTVPLTATGAAPGHMTLTPQILDFGNVQVGSSLTKSFVISNTGAGPMTLTLAKAPEGVFTSGIPAVEGDIIASGATRTITVQFAPNAPRSELGSYILTANDGQGQQAINLVGVGTPSGTNTTALPNLSDSGWSYYGSATQANDIATLTAAGQQFASGTGFYNTAVPSNGLHVSFDAEMGGGGTSGADGMALVLKDSASTINQGSSGEGLGFAGIPGVAVALDTWQNGGSSDPSSNFAAVVNTSTSGGHLNYAATTQNVSNLRTGVHHVDVIISNGKVYVSIDGTNVMVATPSTLPTNVKVGFSAGSGGATDNHIVKNVAITTTTTPGPTGGVSLPGFTDSAWQFNGDASMTSATAATLTTNTTFKAGSAVYTTPVQASGLHVAFDGTIGSGGGADGMTFTLIDPASTPRIGSDGGGLGYSGLTGVAVTIDTYKNWGSADPASNFMSIATSGTGSNLTYATTSVAVPNLRATHHYDIGISGGRLVVAVDGLNVFDQAVTLPSTVLPAFTAGTGGASDFHGVSNVNISTGNTFPASGGSLLPAFSSPNWLYSGGAVTDGSSVTLTTATQQFASTSAFYNQARPSDGIQAAFDTYIGGGSGADGMTFALIDPTQTARTGAEGGGLGYSGLTGVAVTMDTWKNGPEDPSNNFVGIATSGTGSTITYAGTTTAISDLRVGLHHFEISTEGGHLIVKVDGVAVLDVAVTLPPSVLIGFTSGTGGSADIHKVSNVVIRTK
jgi:hypothetical protein